METNFLTDDNIQVTKYHRTGRSWDCRAIKILFLLEDLSIK